MELEILYYIKKRINLSKAKYDIICEHLETHILPFHLLCPQLNKTLIELYHECCKKTNKDCYGIKGYDVFKEMSAIL